MDDKKNDLIDIAKKRRYIALVESLNRRTLSAKEVRELEELQKYFDKKTTVSFIDGTVDLPTICVYLDKSPRMVRRYVRQGMPVIRDSSGEIFRFKVNDVFKWHYGMRGTEEEGGADFWFNEYHKNRAQLLEFQLKQKMGELILFDDHAEIIKNQVRGIKAGFLRLPKYIAPKLYQQDPKIICEKLDEEIRFIINQFAGACDGNKTAKRSSKKRDALRS